MGVTAVIVAGTGESPVPAFTPTDQVLALGVTARPETADDVPFLFRLYASMRWDELSGLAEWSDEQKLAFLAQQFEAQRSHYLTHYHDASFLVVERAGQPVGRLYLFRNPGHIRVVDIGLLPDARNLGLGTALLNALFSEARASGCSVSVHVEVFNPAKNLYERLGFREISDAGPYKLMEWRDEAADL